MKTELNVALIQTDLLWEQPQANRKQIETYFEQLASNTDVVFLSEMFSTGFTMRPELVAESMSGVTIQWMKHWSEKLQVAVAGSIAIEEEGKFYNRFVWVNVDGSIHHYDKRHRYKPAGEDLAYQAGETDGIIDFKGWKVCLRICYDLRFPVWSRNTSDYDLLVFVANWPAPRIHAWDTLLQARAIENMSFTLGVNRIGSDANDNIYPGHSTAYDPLGACLGTAENKPGLTQVTLNKNDQEAIRTQLNFLNDRDSFLLQ